MKHFIGRRADEVVQSWKTLAGVEEPVEDFLADVRRRFYAVMDTAVHPMPGLFVLLDRLRTPGAAGRGRDLVAPFLRRSPARPARASEIDSTFVLASEDVTRGKPDPEIYQLAAERFGVPAGLDARARGQPGRHRRRQGSRRVRRGRPARAQPGRGT